MTFLKRISILLLTLAVILPASAQLSFGPRVGVNLSSLSFDGDLVDNLTSENRAGFTAGLQAELMLPIIGLGVDASIMYVNRSSKYTADGVSKDVSTDYIEIPVNLKYKLGLPAVGNIVAPYFFTGPSFAFRTSKSAIAEALNSKKSDVAWNFGLGVQLFKHLQVGASYGLGLTNILEKTGNDEYTGEKIEGKNKYWTITAAWLF